MGNIRLSHVVTMPWNLLCIKYRIFWLKKQVVFLITVKGAGSFYMIKLILW